MQIVSEKEASLLAQYAKVTLTAYLDGKKVDAGIGNCELAANCGDPQSFSFGNACATSINLVLAIPLPDIKGCRLYVTWAVDGTEHPLFTGKVENAVVTAGRTTVEGWDEMYYDGSDAFIPSYAMQQTVDAADAFSFIASSMGVSVDPDALTLLSGIVIHGGLGHLAEENSNSAVAGHIAGLVGGNALIDRSGQLTVRMYTSVNFTTEPYEGGASAQNSDFIVTGLTLQRKDIVVTTNTEGTTTEEEKVSEFCAGDGTMMVSNPLADQNAADRSYGNLCHISIRPGSYSFPGGLLLDPGDIVTIQSMDGDYSVALIAMTFGIDGGIKTSISCGGKPSSGGAQGPINQALATLFADFANIRKLVAENADIFSARISNLSADDIVAGRIKSTDFESIVLQELYPDVGLFPSQTTYPNIGEEIIRGFEIDFKTGVIRGVFWSEPIAALEQRILELESQIEQQDDRIARLESLLA